MRIDTKLNTRFGRALRAIVDDTIRRHHELSVQAGELMKPFPRNRERVMLRVKAGSTTYYVASLERPYPADVQMAIEGKEKKTFDQLRLEYLRPQDLTLVPFDEANKIVVQENGDTPATLQDLLFSTETNSVVHSVPGWQEK